MRKIPFAGVELTSQRVRGLRGTSELPGRPAVVPNAKRKYNTYYTEPPVHYLPYLSKIIIFPSDTFFIAHFLGDDGRRTAEQGAEHLMAKWIAAEKVRAGPRHAIVSSPNVTRRTKEGIAQSKRARAGSLALVD